MCEFVITPVIICVCPLGGGGGGAQKRKLKTAPEPNHVVDGYKYKTITTKKGSLDMIDVSFLI